MKAISLWQPWATGIALGVKLIETRHWSTPYRGEIAIHAAKRWEADQRAFAEAERAIGTIGFGLPFGAIVAIATLADVKRTEQLVEQLSEQEQRWGNYAPHRYGWIFTDVRPVEKPVPCVGRQSIWSLDGDVVAQLRGWNGRDAKAVGFPPVTDGNGGAKGRAVLLDAPAGGVCAPASLPAKTLPAKTLPAGGA